MPKRLLELDPSLAASAGLRSAPAVDTLLVETRDLPPGPWSPPATAPARGHLGYLLTAGLMLREVRVGHAWSAELLAQGDLLRPWLEDAASFVEAEWRVVQTATVAVLDPTITERLGNWPELLEELVERALRRSRSMAVHAAITATRRVDDRLRLLFWHLAERWGHRTADGVRLDVPLTHATLAHVVGAQRQTITTALGQLVAAEELARTPEGDHWVLLGDPPRSDASAGPPAAN